MRGKRPKPTEAKRLAGNPGKRKLNDREPAPALEIPDCPEHLDDLARAEWNRIAPELRKVGTIALIYRAPLAAYCAAWSRWVRAEQQVIATGGDICTSTEGGKYFNPWRGVADKALQQVTALSESFGMTPSSKSRVSATKPAEESALKVFAARRGA